MELSLFNTSSVDIGLPITKLKSAGEYMFNIYDECWDEINVIIQGNEEHTSLNSKYLGHNYSTDVITFDLSNPHQKLGEIYINVQTAEENATEFRVSLIDELNRLVIHGCLHLCGHEDGTEEEQKSMRRLEDYYLKRFM